MEREKEIGSSSNTTLINSSVKSEEIINIINDVKKVLDDFNSHNRSEENKDKDYEIFKKLYYRLDELKDNYGYIWNLNRLLYQMSDLIDRDGRDGLKVCREYLDYYLTEDYINDIKLSLLKEDIKIIRDIKKAKSLYLYRHTKLSSEDNSKMVVLNETEKYYIDKIDKKTKQYNDKNINVYFNIQLLELDKDEIKLHNTITRVKEKKNEMVSKEIVDKFTNQHESDKSKKKVELSQAKIKDTTFKSISRGR